FKNIKELLQVRPEPPQKLSGKEMSVLPTLKNAWLLTRDGKIQDFGSMDTELPSEADKMVNADGKILMPSWIDAHSHLVYAGNREQEFVDRINGLTYEEIAIRGGGIPNSAKKLQQTSEEELYRQTETRLKEVMGLGTGAIEIKSGYGL